MKTTDNTPKIIYGENSVRIANSYLITSKLVQFGYIAAIMRSNKCPNDVKKLNNKYLQRKWICYNWLYQNNLFVNRTKDINFNKPKWYTKIIYNIICGLINVINYGKCYFSTNR